MGSMGDTKPKQKTKVTKPQKNKKSDEPGKLTFINSKGTANADKIDNEIRNKNKKLELKNVGGLDSAAKDNENVKHTKDYLEKDIKKKYKEVDENVAKPQFITNKEDGENFVELNKNEDVRNIILIFFDLYIQLLAKNMANKNYENKAEYTEKKEGGAKKKEYKKKNFHKKERELPKKKKEEFGNEVDSDGFEIVGTREVKAQKQRDEMKEEYIRRRNEKREKRNKKEKEWKRKQEGEEEGKKEGEGNEEKKEGKEKEEKKDEGVDKKEKEEAEEEEEKEDKEEKEEKEEKENKEEKEEKVEKEENDEKKDKENKNKKGKWEKNKKWDKKGKLDKKGKWDKKDKKEEEKEKKPKEKAPTKAVIKTSGAKNLKDLFK